MRNFLGVFQFPVVSLRATSRYPKYLSKLNKLNESESCHKFISSNDQVRLPVPKFKWI